MGEEIKINFGSNSNSNVNKNKKSKTFKAIIVLIILFLSLSLFFIIKFKDFSFFLKKNENNNIKGLNQNQTQQKLSNQGKISFGNNNIVKLESFNKIRLRQSRGFKFISIDIALELMTIDTIIEKNKKQRIRGVIKNQLGKITWKELKSPEGKLKLKYKLIKEINLVLSKAKIKNLYFINLIMQ